MKNIEEFIKQNQEKFDTSEPSLNHFERFDSKLDKFNQRQKYFSLTFALKAASILLLIFISTLWLRDKLIKDTTNSEAMSLSQVSQEYAEVESYYNTLISNRLLTLNTLGDEGLNMKNELMINEFRELDSLYQNLQLELKSKPDDERVINAMINYYTTKLEIVNTIISKLNKIKSKKTYNNENTEI